MPYLLAGLAVLVLAILQVHLFINSEPKKIIQTLKWLPVALLGALAVFLLVTGKLPHALITAGGALLPLLRWGRIVRQVAGAANYGRAGPRPGKKSEVESKWLHMVLNHDSGEMDGEVVEGPFYGQILSKMSLTDLKSLLELCEAEDPQGHKLLETFMDRNYPDWRDQEGQAGEGQGQGSGAESGFADGMMTRAEAYKILGLEPGASKEAITEAYHRLIRKIHPDQGGSSYLASKLNQARDILLGH